MVFGVYICTKPLHICTAAQTVPNKFLALANFVKRLLISILVTIHKLHLMMYYLAWIGTKMCYFCFFFLFHSHPIPIPPSCITFNKCNILIFLPPLSSLQWKYGTSILQRRPFISYQLSGRSYSCRRNCCF